MISYILDLLYPLKCIVCSKVLPFGTKAPYICDKCKDKFQENPLIFCPDCHKPMDIDVNTSYCLYCNKKHSFSYLIAPFAYAESVRDAILKMKFSACPDYAKTFALYIAERIKKIPHFPKPDLIVPSPISKERKKNRGYNQALLVAKELSRLMDVPAEEVLVKTRETPPQSTLFADQRRKNLIGAITCSHNIDAENVLFVDDVFTTGATAETCAKELKKAGARNVFVATIAINIPARHNKGD